MIRKHIAGSLAGLLLATTMVVAPVFAATSAPTTTPPTAPSGDRCSAEWLAARANPSVTTFRAVGDCEIERRLDTIAKLRTSISGASAMTADHKAALTAILDADQPGLQALRTKIDAGTDLATLRTDVHDIFANFRIYALVTRQVTLVRGDDAVTAAAGRLTDRATRIQAAITKAETKGKDVTVATQKLTAMQGEIAAALAAVNGDAAAVLALTPAGWNAGTAKPVLDDARSSIRTARADLASAVADAKAAIAALK